MSEKRKQYDGQDQLLLSSPKQQKINTIRNQNKGLKRKMVRTKKKISKLRSELDNIKGRMATHCDPNIEEKLCNIKGINDSQKKTLIKEYFKASKIVNPKNRRYNENWLMFCLLFNICSPGAYKYLRDSQLLSLPHPKTVCQFLSSI